jgi:ornithine carbamoyltransferase
MGTARHFLQLKDFTLTELEHLFERTVELKARQRQGRLYQPLTGRTLAMLIEKNSTRTRVSFEAGMAQLGGNAMFLSTRHATRARRADRGCGRGHLPHG